MRYEQKDCLDSLAGISASLKSVAKAAGDCWVPGIRRWGFAVGESEYQAYDLAGTLDESFTGNDLRRVLRWVEFHTESGPARRRRLNNVLSGLRDEIYQIEGGNQWSDPFRWRRESIDAAASDVINEVEHVSEYIGELIQLIEGKETSPFVPNEFQLTILEALKGRALKVDALAEKTCGGDRSRLYKRDGIKELRSAGRVDRKNRLGYYRPDAPPSVE